MNIENSHNYRKISEQVTTSGVVDKVILNRLSHQGYEVVINLLPIGHKKEIKDEKDIIHSQGIDYIYLPVSFEEPKQADVEQFISILEKIGNKKVHIHCSANWRVSVFYSIFLVEKDIWSIEQAENFILSIWQPKEYPAWQQLLNLYGLAINNR